MKTIIPLISCIFLFSCVAHYYTEEGGVRLKNPKRFNYNSNYYLKRNSITIDTTAIYLIDSLYNPNNPNYKMEKGHTFIRFFSTGQVLFVDSNETPLEELINNSKIGTPGYFYIHEDKIRISEFQNLNGGQTGKYFGKILQNGDLMFYQQRPETYPLFTYRGLENYGSKTFWKRIEVDSMEYYRPDW